MRPRTLAPALLAIAAVVGALPGSAKPAHAAAGALDSSFGGDGIVVTTFAGADASANAVAVQPDGRVVAAGSSQQADPIRIDFALARYHPDGSLDTTFDGDGKLTTAFGSSGNQAAWHVLIQPDGRILAAGYASNGSDRDFALARYNPDGSLDTTFDGDGMVTTPIGTSDDVALAVAIQPDGKIVAAGHSSAAFGFNNAFALARYNPDGSLDTTFDGDGRLTTPIGTVNDVARAVAIQPDGKIVAAGHSNNGSNADFALARYNTDGSLDTTFDTDGKVITALGAVDDAANALALQPDGRILAAGSSQVGSTNEFALVRYAPGGSLDATFDGDGKVTTAIGSGSSAINGVVLQPDGRIVAAGSSIAGATNDFALARYNPEGSLDTTFDGDGKVTTEMQISAADVARGVALTPDGRIVTAGSSLITGVFGDFVAFALAQYDWTTCTITGDPNNNNLKGTSGPDVICGLGGNDTLTGLGGDDILIGGDGNDTLLGGKGNDALLGGTSVDSAQFQDSGVSGPLTVDLQNGIAANSVLGTDTILRVGGLSTIENVEGSPGPDTIIGDAQRNLINGKAGNDVIAGGDGDDQIQANLGDDDVSGGDGDDTIMPGPGTDTADGGPGIDVLRYTDVATGVTVTLNAGSQLSSKDSISGFESLIGTPAADSLTAALSGIASLVMGAGGDDTLNVADGDGLDTIYDNVGTGQVCVTDAADTVLACT